MAFILNATTRIAMSYSLAEAAAAVGLNKTSILRAIKSGKISGTKDAHGQWLVEPAELHRVHPPLERSDANPTADAATPRHAAPEDMELRIRMAAAEQELSVLKDLVAELRTQRDDLRLQRDDMRAQREDMQAQRDVWQAEAQRLALPAPRPTEEGTPAPETSTPVTRPAMTRKQRLVKFWFGKQYQRRAG
jgi:hypothetical protein